MLKKLFSWLKKPFASTTVGLCYSIISVFYKRDISVSYFAVAIIHKATTWLFKQKIYSFTRGEGEIHSLILFLRTFPSPLLINFSRSFVKKEQAEEKKGTKHHCTFTAFVYIQFKHRILSISVEVVSLSSHRWGRIIEEYICSCFSVHKMLFIYFGEDFCLFVFISSSKAYVFKFRDFLSLCWDPLPT